MSDQIQYQVKVLLKPDIGFEQAERLSDFIQKMYHSDVEICFVEPVEVQEKVQNG